MVKLVLLCIISLEESINDISEDLSRYITYTHITFKKQFKGQTIWRNKKTKEKI